jgi:hypothetical protein
MLCISWICFIILIICTEMYIIQFTEIILFLNVFTNSVQFLFVFEIFEPPHLPTVYWYLHHGSERY